MPEGDTVYRQTHLLHRALAGARVLGTDLRFPAVATTDLSGWTVKEVVPRGKHLMMRFLPPEGDPSPPTTVHSHLRMEGYWRVYDQAPSRGRPKDHRVRAVVDTAAVRAVGTDLGMLTVLPTAEEDRVVGYLGPDLLGPDWDLEEALRRLRSAPGRPVGAALMDQRNLAGIGNVYRNEVLFLHRTHPLRPLGEVPDLPGLVLLAHRLLRANRLRSARSTVGGPARRGEQFWVYGRSRQRCRRCSGALRQIEVDDSAGAPPSGAGQGTAGQGTVPLLRPVWFCPRCQPV